MYAFINGVVRRKDDKHIIVENNGIGYYIQVIKPSDYEVDNSYTIVTHQYIKEDINVLYGFSSYEEKDLFVLLLSVSGIGPKSAFNIVGNEDVSKTYKAIEDGNIDYLKSFTGIGTKAASQIILKLQGKINQNSSDLQVDNEKLNHIIEALVNLGYSKKDFLPILKKSDFTLSESELIKNVLKNLL